jgi:hypothetical protein
MNGYEESRYLLRMVTDRLKKDFVISSSLKDMQNPIDLVNQAADVTYS